MNQEDLYYKHSGNFDIVGPMYLFIFGITGSLILSLIYGYAIHYIPLPYINFFITLGFGGILGYIIFLGGKVGKVRNIRLLLYFSLFFGVLAVYMGWISWIYAFSKQETLITSPLQFLTVIGELAEDGIWSIFGWTPKKGSLYTIWIIEALMITGTTVIVPVALLNITPFCETCEQWVEQKDSIYPLEPIEKTKEFTSQLEKHDFKVLTSLKKIDTESELYTLIELHYCPTCMQLFLLTVKSVKITTKSNGKEKESKDTIIDFMRIDSKNYEMLKKQW